MAIDRLIPVAKKGNAQGRQASIALEHLNATMVILCETQNAIRDENIVEFYNTH
jgi:hypothetical protein